MKKHTHTSVRSDMFLVTYTILYEEMNALEACRTSNDMLRITYAWYNSRRGGVAYIRKGGSGGGRERETYSCQTWMLTDPPLFSTTYKCFELYLASPWT